MPETAVARVVRRLDVRHPVRIRVIAVVPAIGNRRVAPQQLVTHEDLQGERVGQVAVQVLLQQLGIDLPAEPDEALHRIDLFVRLRGLALHRVVDVVDRRFGAPVIRHLRATRQRDVRAVVRVVRVHAALIRAADRQPDVVALAAARHRDVRVDHQTRLPEITHVVRVRRPRAHAEELVARVRAVINRVPAHFDQRVGGDPDASTRPIIHHRPPALVRPVVLAAEVAVDEVEFAVEALPVLVLIIRQAQRRFSVHAEVRRDAEAGAGRAFAALRRVHDRAVRGARAVQCRGVRTLQHRHGRNVVTADV